MKFAVHCSVVLRHDEVVAVTAELDLTGTMRRFFQPQQLYRSAGTLLASGTAWHCLGRPAFSGVALGLLLCSTLLQDARTPCAVVCSRVRIEGASAKLALELYPPGFRALGLGVGWIKVYVIAASARVTTPWPACGRA